MLKKNNDFQCILFEIWELFNSISELLVTGAGRTNV